MRSAATLMRAIVVTGLAVFLATPAQAQSEPEQSVNGLPCHPYNDLASQLDQKYHEAPVSMGIQSNGNLLQVFSSTESGTWTILSIAPNGRPCVLAAGKSWERFKLAAIDPTA